MKRTPKSHPAQSKVMSVRPWVRSDAPSAVESEELRVKPRRSLSRTAPLVAKSPMKKPRKASTPARKAARGQDCCVRFPGCPNDTATTVLAHLRMFGGGGVGMKPLDREAVYADFHCHEILDGRVPWIQTDDDNWTWWQYIAWALIRTGRAQTGE